ncbi:hypothetical protein B0H10DRAFT_2053483 [Mycena sp. CBHHK59/15]|nr:hypothetical protein B0H10DRAFT_2053483 [Mycena sp. CBHHK59/15]
MPRYFWIAASSLTGSVAGSVCDLDPATARCSTSMGSGRISVQSARSVSEKPQRTQSKYAHTSRPVCPRKEPSPSHVTLPGGAMVWLRVSESAS